MSVSVDIKKMEKLKQLEEVLNLLQNPEGYHQLLGEVKTALTRMEQSTKKYATVEQAERLLSDANVILNSAKEEAKKIREQVAQEQYKSAEMVKDQTKKIKEALDSARTKENQLSKDLEDLAQEKLKLKEEKETFSIWVKQTQKEITDRDAASKELAQKISEKAAILKSLAE